MERRSRAGSVVAVLVVIVVVYGTGVDAQNPYTCVGGCYNECFQTSNGRAQQPKGPSCYYQCLTGCNPTSPNDLKFYCELGCSIKWCIPASYDGARLENCFSRCTNICSI